MNKNSIYSRFKKCFDLPLSNLSPMERGFGATQSVFKSSNLQIFKLKILTFSHLHIFTFVLFAYIALPENAFGQSAYIGRNHPSWYLLERLEIKSGNLKNDLFLDAGPVERNVAENFIWGSILKDTQAISVTRSDSYWRNYTLADNISGETSLSKKPILKYFYRHKAALYSNYDSNFAVVVNPVLALGIGFEQDSANYRYKNTRGVEVRGHIGNKVGFYTYFADNQVKFPGYIQQYYRATKAIPGEGFWKPFRDNATDFATARGYITFSPIKQIHMQFGHDRNFIGSGFRSLLLSDFAKDYLFLKINTRVWRFQYQNIFAEMTNAETRFSSMYPKKYAAMHYLSFDVAKWLNFGLFEGIAFHDNLNNGRGFDFNYLNPVIFYRSVEHNLGSPDNALVGANLNILMLKRVKLYGQFLLDEFKLSELRNDRGWWGNKYGLQAGFKWIDIFGLPNVDLQSEFNLIRPYTYTSDTSGKNWVNFNQPLAHPIGANLREVIGILRFNTFGPLNIQLKYAYRQQGEDTAKSNFGSNIAISYNKVPKEYGNSLLQGVLTTTTFAELMASYQLKHNLFLDASVLYRTRRNAFVTDNTFFVSAGLRLNFINQDHTF